MTWKIEVIQLIATKLASLNTSRAKVTQMRGIE